MIQARNELIVPGLLRLQRLIVVDRTISTTASPIRLGDELLLKIEREGIQPAAGNYIPGKWRASRPVIEHYRGGIGGVSHQQCREVAFPKSLCGHGCVLRIALPKPHRIPSSKEESLVALNRPTHRRAEAVSV